jgi:beta-glucosidase
MREAAHRPRRHSFLQDSPMPSAPPDSRESLSFPRGFVWGVATSAYQIEGAVTEGGRGESIWDRFCATPGKVLDGSSGATACDHYHRWRDDVDLMREMGVAAYRFSVAWPRVLPQGRGRVNEEGLAFYDRLVDALLEAGITPFVTLYHWDLPQALQDEGGWGNRGTVNAFVAYADTVSRRLGDRVGHWITHNEPWCVSLLSHHLGAHAPGMKDLPTALRVAHHVLLSHGEAVPVIRGNTRPGSEVGITLNFEVATPASPSAADRDAARHADGAFNRWFLDPVFGRRYPADVVQDYRDLGALPLGEPDWIQPGDLARIAVPTDFLGVNYYTRRIVRSATLPEFQNEPPSVSPPPPSELTTMGWEVYPEGLYGLLCRIHFEYGPRTLYVTENGSAYPDEVSPDGAVHDARRVAYLRQHLEACARAARAGVPLAGYFAWSLMDNFEWERGYTQRFGIVHVDYATQARTPKDTARHYAGVIREQGRA